VKSIAVQPDGKILIAGAFAEVAGQPRRGLARLHADGTLDSSFTVGTGSQGGFNGTVWSVIVALDGSVYAGGSFSSYNGRSVFNNLAKLSATGEIDTRFNYAGSVSGGINNAVRSVSLRPGGGILVAGQFTQIANSILFPTPVSVGRVAQFEPGGTLSPAFNPVGIGANNTVLAATALENGNLVLVGAFTQFNRQALPRIAVLTGTPPPPPGAPEITSPPTLTMPAGQTLSHQFTASLPAQFAEIAGFLPRGVDFDAATGRVSGIPLDAGEFVLEIEAIGISGLSSGIHRFVLNVEPAAVSFETWRRVWFNEAELAEPGVSGADGFAGNSEGLSNFAVYALTGGNPRASLPTARSLPGSVTHQGATYYSVTLPKYPLARVHYEGLYSENLSDWSTDPAHVRKWAESLTQVTFVPTEPMSARPRQFLRIRMTSTEEAP